MDGTALGGQICVDEGTITGEPVPVPKSPGGTVIARTLGGTGPLRVTATKVGADTVLAQILSMAEQAQGARLPIQGMIADIFAWFEPAVPVDRCTDRADVADLWPRPGAATGVGGRCFGVVPRQPLRHGSGDTDIDQGGPGRAAEWVRCFARAARYTCCRESASRPLTKPARWRRGAQT